MYQSFFNLAMQANNNKKQFANIIKALRSDIKLQSYKKYISKIENSPKTI